MSLETRLHESLHGTLDSAELPPGDLATVTRLGRTRQRRTRVATGSAVLGVVAVIGGVAWAAGPGSGRDRVQPTAPGGTWVEAEPAPLSPRVDALSGWTGEEALFVGGSSVSPCPPNAECAEPPPPAQRDGAAYDPDSDSWRRIAAAPVPMEYYFRTTMVGDTMVVFGEGRWFGYDAGEDAWREYPQPPERLLDTGWISAHDGSVYALGRSGAVQVLDVSANSWSALPVSPLLEDVSQSSVAATDEGVVVSGFDTTREYGPDEPTYVRAQVWDGEQWTLLPETGQVWPHWHWTGERLVSGDLQTATGLDGNPPYGGVLDVGTGEWSPLPNAPDIDAPGPGGWSLNANEGPLLAGWGYVYDDSDQTWTPLGKPAGTDVDADQSAVWADGQLVVFAGLDTETGYESTDGLSNDAWVWTP